MSKKKIIVIGAGFAGVKAAKTLSKNMICQIKLE